MEPELVDKVAKCPKCDNCFKDPRILHCGHTACLTCIQDLVKPRANDPQFKIAVRCPECNANCLYASDDVTALPKNYLLSLMLEYMSSGEAGKCEECSYACVAQSRGLWYCTQCEMVICATCTLARHKRHAVIQYQEFYNTTKKILDDAITASKKRHTDVSASLNEALMILEAAQQTLKDKHQKLSAQFQALVGAAQKEGKSLTSTEIHELYKAVLSMDKDLQTFQKYLGEEIQSEKYPEIVIRMYQVEASNPLQLPLQRASYLFLPDSDTSDESTSVISEPQGRVAGYGPKAGSGGKHGLGGSGGDSSVRSSRSHNPDSNRLNRHTSDTSLPATSSKRGGKGSLVGNARGKASEISSHIRGVCPNGPNHNQHCRMCRYMKRLKTIFSRHHHHSIQNYQQPAQQVTLQRSSSHQIR